MDAAFLFVLPAPTACARVFACGNGARAGGAANRRIAPRHKRMTGQAVIGDIVLHILARPMGQRVDFDPYLGLIFEEVKRRAALRLKAFAPRDPRVKRGQGVFKRFGLALGAAGIGVGFMQIALRVACRNHRAAGVNAAHIFKAQMICQVVLIG